MAFDPARKLEFEQQQLHGRCGLSRLAHQFVHRHRRRAEKVNQRAALTVARVHRRRRGGVGSCRFANHPRAQGCNLLIREGATLIQTVDDVLEAVGPIDARMVREPARPYTAAPAPMNASDGERRSLIDLLGPTPVAVDELVRQSGQAASTVQLLLLELELAGRVERHAGAKISLV